MTSSLTTCRRALDLSSLTISKDSFVDETLREHFSDLLYTVSLRGGGEIHLYVLLEHKSLPEPLTAFQLLRYMVRVWELDLRQRNALLSILPVVVYHGKPKWPAGETFHELLRPPSMLADFVPDYRYWLCDLSEYEDDGLKGAVVLRVALLLMKHVVREDIADHLPRIFSLLRELAGQGTGLEYLETMLRYVVSATDRVDEADLEEAIQAAVGAAGGATVPTLAQKWLEQGRQEGIHQGLLQGIELGLELKFGTDGLRFLSDLRNIEDLATLRAVHDALRSAETLDELQGLCAPTESPQ